MPIWNKQTPHLDKNGFHKLTLKYDEQNNIIKKDYLNTNKMLLSSQ